MNSEISINLEIPIDRSFHVDKYPVYITPSIVHIATLSYISLGHNLNSLGLDKGPIKNSLQFGKIDFGCFFQVGGYVSLTLKFLV